MGGIQDIYLCLSSSSSSNSPAGKTWKGQTWYYQDFNYLAGSPRKRLLCSNITATMDVAILPEDTCPGWQDGRIRHTIQEVSCCIAMWLSLPATSYKIVIFIAVNCSDVEITVSNSIASFLPKRRNVCVEDWWILRVWSFDFEHLYSSKNFLQDPSSQFDNVDIPRTWSDFFIIKG